MTENTVFIDPNGPEARASAEAVARRFMDEFASDEAKANWHGNIVPARVDDNYLVAKYAGFSPLTDISVASRYPNPSGINPTEYRVLILPTPYEKVTKGGIIKPDEIAERESFATQDGTIIAVSHLAFTYATDEEWAGKKPKPGDKVIFAKYAGFRRKGVDGQDYQLVSEKDVCAVIE